jgi:hypothetical protein
MLAQPIAQAPTTTGTQGLMVHTFRNVYCRINSDHRAAIDANVARILNLIPEQRSQNKVIGNLSAPLLRRAAVTSS